jgi:hypothetical protein
MQGQIAKLLFGVLITVVQRTITPTIPQVLKGFVECSIPETQKAAMVFNPIRIFM